MATKHMKRWSTSLVIMEMQVKTLLRYYLTPTRIATIKKTDNNKCCQTWRNLEPSYIVGNVNVQLQWKRV